MLGPVNESNSTAMRGDGKSAGIEVSAAVIGIYVVRIFAFWWGDENTMCVNA